MPRVERLSGGDCPILCAQLEKLRKECATLNAKAEFVNNERVTHHIIKQFNSKGEPYFVIVKRKYQKREKPESEEIFTAEQKELIQSFKQQNKSLSFIAKELNTTPYFVQKYLNSSI